MIRTFVFSQGRLINQDLSLDLLRVVLYDDDVQVWVDMEKSSPEENKSVLETVFDFHPLAIEDCVGVSERPKIDDYENYVFMVIHAVDYINSRHVFQTTELNLFIGRNFLVTFHDEPLRSTSVITLPTSRLGYWRVAAALLNSTVLRRSRTKQGSASASAKAEMALSSLGAS